MSKNSGSDSASANVSDLVSVHSLTFSENLEDIEHEYNEGNSDDMNENSNESSESEREKNESEVKKWYFIKQNSETINARDRDSESAKRKASESPDTSAINKRTKPVSVPHPETNTNTPPAPNPAAMPRRATAAAAAAAKTPRYSIPLQNRYNILPVEETNSDDEASSETPIVNQTTRSRPPAPIVIPGTVTNHQGLIKNLKDTVKHGFNIKYTRNNINVYLDNKEDKINLLNKIKTELQYHTYTDKDDKTHAFVIRGLDCEPPTEIIIKELKDVYKTHVKNIYKMKTKYRPLYLVVTPAGTTLRELQSIKHINYTRITWERHENKKIITQCHRCQDWGHATSNCNKNPKCVKCGQSHLSSTCEKTRDTPATCANCKGAHPANYSECPEYIKKIKEISTRNPRILNRTINKNTTEFVPAPAPAVNAWSRRSEPRVPTTVSSDAARAPDIADRARFPALPQRQMLEQRSSLQQPAPAPQTQQPPAQTTNISDSYNVFNELSNEIKNLNNMVNLENLLKFIKDLNARLRLCSDSQSRTLTTIEFMTQIDSYSI